MVSISEGFGDLGITISHQQISQMERLVVHFHLRKTHPLTLDGPYLGVDPIAFTTSDYNALFDLFKIHPKDVELMIRSIGSIDQSFVVTSDPFNLLSIWLCHLAPIFIKDARVCQAFMQNVIRYYHYKLFCSIVNNTFRHGANRGIMDATIASLSKKSDIIRYESWNLLLESHVEKMVSPDSRFYGTIIEGGPDDLFLRVISESQTALRQKIITFANTYYAAHAAGDSMGSISAIAQNDEGEKIIAQTASVIDSATSSMVSEILNPNLLIHEPSVRDIVKLFTNVSFPMLKTALLQINKEAVLQTSSRTFDKVNIDKKTQEVTYIGIRALIIQIIRSMIATCRDKRVNMGNRAKVFDEMRKAYSSSRIQDSNILAVKRSVSELVDPFNITVNEASKSALRLAVIYYFLYRSMLKMKT